ncbi:hypothetical protein D3C85_1770480 [compost metagenome]
MGHKVNGLYAEPLLQQGVDNSSAGGQNSHDDTAQHNPGDEVGQVQQILDQPFKAVEPNLIKH